MSFYAIVKPKVEPSDLSIHTDVLEELNLDYTDLLQLALTSWHESDVTREDDEGLRVAVENHLATYALRHLRDYAHLQQVVPVIVHAVAQFHDTLREQLGPLLDTYGLDVQVRLSRYLHRDALIRIETDL